LPNQQESAKERKRENFRNASFPLFSKVNNSSSRNKKRVHILCPVKREENEKMNIIQIDKRNTSFYK